MGYGTGSPTPSTKEQMDEADRYKSQHGTPAHKLKITAQLSGRKAFDATDGQDHPL